jgi:hypothetical protein
MWASTPSQTRQELISARVTSESIHGLGSGIYQNVILSYNKFDWPDSQKIWGWDVNQWQEGHNSFVVKGQTVQVWAAIGYDSMEGLHVIAVSQNPWPHTYSIGRFIMLVLCIVFLGLYIFQPSVSVLLR